MDELTIDFGSAASLQAAYPKVVERRRDAEQRRDAASREADRWSELGRLISELAAEHDVELARDDEVTDDVAETTAGSDAENNGERPSGGVPKAIEAIEAIEGPASVDDVHARMPEFARKTVGWALWKAHKEGKISKVGAGTYAPLSYRRAQLVPAGDDQ